MRHLSLRRAFQSALPLLALNSYSHEIFSARIAKVAFKRMQLDVREQAGSSAGAILFKALWHLRHATAHAWCLHTFALQKVSREPAKLECKKEKRRAGARRFIP